MVDHLEIHFFPSLLNTVADPGFPVGGAWTRRGGVDSEAATFRKICMSKRKNLVP